MDGFGDNFVPNGESSGAAAEDPAADFLAREQNELAGLEDPPVITDGESDALEQPQVAADADAALPASDGLNSEASAATLLSESAAGDSAEPATESATEPAVAEPIAEPTPERVVTPVPRVEPEAIRIWREEHQQKLVEKDAEEEKAKDALREKAKQELAEWYKQHDEQVAKTRQANRCAEKELVADTERPEPGTEWERISKLCDFNPKTAKSSRDVSRMRSIILHVKQNPPVKA